MVTTDDNWWLWNKHMQKLLYKTVMKIDDIKFIDLHHASNDLYHIVTQLKHYNSDKFIHQ